MGGSYYSKDDMTARTAHRAATKASVFVHDAAIKSGTIHASIHKDMDPKGVTMRECRDSVEHPVSVPIGIVLDTTGSMQQVPVIIQAALNKLMGVFLEDKASGKKYLGDGYPSICIACVDDFEAGSREGALQVGQFESGLEIDDNLGKIWFTGAGGGNNGESYDLAAYFFARHTAHDHKEKRNKKGHLFFIGDEPWLPLVRRESVAAVVGDTLQQDIPTPAIFEELERSYNVYFIVPNLTNHYGDSRMLEAWKKILGERVIKLEDPQEICTLIASMVAVNEGHVDVADLSADGISSTVTTALAPFASSAVAGYTAANLPIPAGVEQKVERL